MSHRERRTPSHRNSVLNTIATPSRNSPRLLSKAALSPEKAETCEKQRRSLGRDTPTMSGTGKTRDKQSGGRQENANVLTNSLISDNVDNGDDVIDNDDVVVIDDEEEEADVSIIDRISPMASTSSKAAVSTVHPTPTVYSKFQPKSSKVREERRASAAAVVELFSSEDDNDDTMERDDSLIRPTPEIITRKMRRKESVARGPLLGVAPEIMRQDCVMKAPLVRVSPLLVTNEEPTAIKQKNEQAKVKVGTKTPRLRKETRTEECMSDDPAIEAKNLVERNKEFVMEDPLAMISPKRCNLRSSRRKPSTNRGETPGLIDKPVMEDPLARLSPLVKKRKLRSSRKETMSTHEAAPGMIKELVREELDEESPDPTVELREEPVTEKRRTRSSCGVAPELMKQTRKEKIVTEKRVLRSRNPVPSEENALLGANQIAPDKKTETVSSSKATGNHQAHKRNLDKEMTTATEVKRTIRCSTRTATIVSTQSSENDRPYIHDSLEGLSSESEWKTTDDDDDDDDGGDFTRRCFLKPSWQSSKGQEWRRQTLRESTNSLMPSTRLKVCTCVEL